MKWMKMNMIRFMKTAQISMMIQTVVWVSMTFEWELWLDELDTVEIWDGFDMIYVSDCYQTAPVKQTPPVGPTAFLKP